MLWWKLLGIIGVIIGVGGVAYGADQHQQRETEKGTFAAELRLKEKRLSDIEARFGRQSEQFKIMAEELRRYTLQIG